MTKPTFIEVCSGCGGLSTGFMNGGFEPILLNEVDKTCCQTLRKNHKNVLIDNSCMRNLDLSKYKNSVDVLMGGVPCQSFSQAGQRKGIHDERGGLVIDFNRLVVECEPKIFLVENVKGLLTIEKGELFKTLISMFENEGKYKIYTKVLNAKNFGVPQKRERLFIIGVHFSITRMFTFPNNTTIPERKLRDILIDVPTSLGVQYPEWKREVLDLVPPGGCWVDLPTDIRNSYMGQKALHSGGGKRGMTRRLSMDEQCLTLTTSPYQRQTERCHPTETRPFTIREYARIQTFPDTYEFCGSVLNQYRQIGNAVPVHLAYHLATHIKSFLQS